MHLQKTSALKNVSIFKVPLVCANHFFPNKPPTQTFLTLQPKWTPEEDFVLIIIQLSEVEIKQNSELFELL